MKLFKSGDVTSWKSGSEKVDPAVMKDYQRAKKNILPKETNDMKTSIRMDEYLNKQVMMQIIYFFKRDRVHLHKNFYSFAERMHRSFAHEDHLWNKFYNHVS